jgi:uracil DNA glycosylase
MFLPSSEEALDFEECSELILIHLALCSMEFFQHPSPLSAHKGFLGNGHFKKANEWLVERYGVGAAIDWTRLNIEETA